MNDVVVIIVTDLIWTLIGLFGVYYSVGEILYALQGSRYYEETGRDSFGRRMNRTAIFHIIAVVIAVLLGLAVVGVDIYDWYSGVVLSIDTRRTFYRMVLEVMFGCLILAMREQDLIRDLLRESAQGNETGVAESLDTIIREDEDRFSEAELEKREVRERLEAAEAGRRAEMDAAVKRIEGRLEGIRRLLEERR